MVFQKGHKTWNIGLTKETSRKIREMAKKQSKTRNKLIREGKLKVIAGYYDKHGEKNPNYKGIYEFNCQFCGKKVILPFHKRTTAGRLRKFCSKSCSTKFYLSKI